MAVEAHEQRHRERDLRLHSLGAHEVAASEQVEDLVVAAHLEVAVDDDRVVSLQHGVDELMQGDGLLVGVTVVEVLTLKDACHVELRHEVQHALQVERLQPVTVVHDGGLLGVEHLHGLFDVGLGIGLDLLLSERRTGGVTARRVTDKGGAVADDEGHFVAEVLELAHLAQRDGMAEVQVGRRGVNAELDVERRVLLELLPELVERNDLHGARRDDLELFFNWQQRTYLHTLGHGAHVLMTDGSVTQSLRIAHIYDGQKLARHFHELGMNSFRPLRTAL